MEPKTPLGIEPFHFFKKESYSIQGVEKRIKALQDAITRYNKEGYTPKPERKAELFEWLSIKDKLPR